MNSKYEIVSSILILFIFGFLVYAFVFKKQEVKLNWAIFYSFLYTSTTLPIINILCINYGFWEFNKAGLNRHIHKCPKMLFIS